MNTPRALGPVVMVLLCVTPVPGCGEDAPIDTASAGTTGILDTTGTRDTIGDPPPDVTTTDTLGTTGTTGTTGDPPADVTTTGTTGPTSTADTTEDPPADTTGTTGDPSTTGPDSDGESAGTTATSDSSSSSSGDDSSGSGTSGGELVMLGNTPSCPVKAEAGPSLPQEAGHLAATVLTPDTYPFAVSHVQYGLARKPIADCVNTYAHRVEIFVTEGGKPPPKPSTDASTFVSIAVEESFEDIDLRVLEPKLDPPIVLTDGQSLVVAVSLEADVDANLSLCLASCVGAAIPGVDYWSYAAAEPYKWVDLVANYNWPANFKIYAFGTAL